ncbi:aldo/keto reductase [Pseudenhygromyxa sp. WMMC2535]|uniref:aldo/keto reductase n=1 Tax=Pseudenhygromyxa sp. WMMC2535 TaxID=2712867 RepID=UPI001555B4BF|nr:aldo/keto reductase [Pseudenhygromyxa sp. WMMC2535]NVB41454.1 aldo/keto reductase [Pseudenhygromyxa sp. WMMC2535]
MKTHQIGSLEASAVGLGCNNFGWHIDQAQTQKVVDAAIAAGITMFDTADVYGEGRSEVMLAKALGSRREKILIATKVGMGKEKGGGAPDYVRQECEASLQRLGTDYIDLYYLHQPDSATPIADTLGALSRLVEAGKVREVACSNFSAAQLHEAAKVGTSKHFAAVQNEFSLLERAPERDGVLAAANELGVALVPYFPLKSGLLTGKYRKGSTPEGSRLNAGKDSKFAGMGDALLTDQNLDTVEALIAFCEQRGHTILELAFSWLLAHEGVASVIAGATKPEQIRGNVAAAGWALSDEELAAVDEILAG